MPSLSSTATYTLSAPVAVQVIFNVGGLVGGTVNDTSGAGVAGGAVAGAAVVGGWVVGAAVAGVVATTVVGAATVVTAAATVVAVEGTTVVDDVSLLLEVAAAESLLREDVELQAPSTTSDVARTMARRRRFNIR